MIKKLVGKISNLFLKSIIFILLVFSAYNSYAGTLSCSVTTAASCTGTVVYRMSGSTNAHVQLPSQSNPNYDNNVVCCSGVTGLGNSCSGVYDVALRLEKITNAHSQINSQLGYTNNACISVPTGGSISVGYVTSPTTCSSAGYDTTLGSIFSNTNSHVGDINAYNTKICATGSATAQLPISGVFSSSVFDTTANSSSVGYNSIMWKGIMGTGKVLFQLATSASSTGPWNYYGGSTCGAFDWFQSAGPNTPIELKGADCFSNWNNKRYFRYKVKICSGDCSTSGATSPVIDKIIINWSS